MERVFTAQDRFPAGSGATAGVRAMCRRSLWVSDFRLTNYAEIKAKVNDQRLLGAINHAPGFKPMPYPAGSPKMPQCQLDQVRIWIQGGALNN